MFLEWLLKNDGGSTDYEQLGMFLAHDRTSWGQSVRLMKPAQWRNYWPVMTLNVLL